MQKEKINRPFFKYWKSFTSYELRVPKAIESKNKVLGRLFFLFRGSSYNAVILRKIIPYKSFRIFDYIYRICNNEYFN